MECLLAATLIAISRAQETKIWTNEPGESTPQTFQLLTLFDCSGVPANVQTGSGKLHKFLLQVVAQISLSMTIQGDD